MTVSTTIIKNSYSGDGSQHSFAYGFKIFADADLDVIIRSSTGVETVKVLDTDYVVTNAGNDSGGNVLFKYNTGNTGDAHYSATDKRPQSGETIVIRRSLDKTQSTDYVANDPFPAESHEDALDRLTFISQEIQEETDRSIKLSRTNTMTSTEFTVGATDRANKVLAFDSSGEISVTQELGIYKGTDATTTTAAYVQRDIIKSTTAAQLNNVYICVADSVVGDLLTDTDHFELLIDAVTAATSATNAASSASAAATSETNAATSESNAATSETNAATSESNASTSETNAATSATSASNSATSAASSATTATTKASEASTSATNAATSESNASTSATNAATSATNASTSETNAATSATTATTQASAASTSASNAATSATSATAAQSAAETAQTAAESAQTAAEAALDTFDDRFLGAKASDPTLDNDGNALIDGALYFDTTNDIMKVYDLTNTTWRQLTLTSANQTNVNTVAGQISPTNNISTVAGDSADIGTLAGLSTDIQSLADIEDGTTATNAISNVGNSITNVNTVASNLSSVNSFANTYRIGATDPTTSLDTGDLFYNTTSSLLKVYTGSAWEQGVTAGSGFLATTGGALTGNLTFGDNNKAIFGAGSDLQIYHDSFNSYIEDVATGSLIIRGTDLHLQDREGNDYIGMEDTGTGGTVRIKHNASTKLTTASTGIDVTGTVTADGLTMDTGDNTVYRLEFGANRGSDEQALGIIRGSWNGTVVSQINLSAGDDTTNKDNGQIFFRTASAGTTANRLRIEENGDISFYEDTGTTPKLLWDASTESLLIGDTTTNRPAEFSHPDGFAIRGDTVGQIQNTVTDNANALFNRDGTDGTILNFRKEGTEIGYIGVDGGNNPYFSSAVANHGGLLFSDGGSSTPQMNPVSSGTTLADNAMNIGSPTYRFKNLYLGGTAQTSLINTGSSTGTLTLYGGSTNQGGKIVLDGGNNDGDIVFHTGQFTATPSNRMQIFNNGNVTIGTTNQSPAESSTATGARIGNTGKTQISSDSGETLMLNRNTNDGTLINFRRAGSEVGAIQSFSGCLAIGSYVGNDSFIRFGNSDVRPVNSSGTDRDNGIDLGSTSARFKNFYLSGGIGFDSTISMSFASGGNIGVGNTGPGYPLHVGTSSLDKRGMFQGSNQYRLGLKSGTADHVWLGSGGANNFRVSNSSGSTLMELTSAGQVVAASFSGNGSALTNISGTITTTTGSPAYYGARAFVNMVGDGTVSIRNSQNVSSITDEGTGKYRLNFSTAMPDANFTCVSQGSWTNANTNDHHPFVVAVRGRQEDSHNASWVKMSAGTPYQPGLHSAVQYDADTVEVAIFR